MRFKGDRNRIYEDYRLGKLVDLMLTDERQYRDQQPCNDAHRSPAAPSADDPRTMLGAKQLDWFLRTPQGLQGDLEGLGHPADGDVHPRSRPTVAAQVDAWDGYGYERKQILDYILDNDIQNVVAITGDIHTFFAGTAYTTRRRERTGQPRRVPRVRRRLRHLGRPAPRRPGFPPSDARGVLATSNPHIDFYDFVNKGYGVLTVEGERARSASSRRSTPRRPNAGTADDHSPSSASPRRPVAGRRSPAHSDPGRAAVR